MFLSAITYNINNENALFCEYVINIHLNSYKQSKNDRS